MTDQFYIGDDFDECSLVLSTDDAVLDFSSASLVRWWMIARGGIAPVIAPKTLTNASPQAFAAGTVYPILTAAETANLAATDYTIFVEITLAGKIRTFRYSSITFTSRGV